MSFTAPIEPKLEGVLNEIPDTEENKSLRRDLQRAMDEMESTVSEFTPKSPSCLIGKTGGRWNKRASR